jgi:hypothetical protein
MGGFNMAKRFLACTDFAKTTHLTRRQLLQVGTAGFLGLSLPQFLAASERASGRANQRHARAEAIILLHQFGGPPQMDTFDIKPHAPQGIRSEFQPIQTNVPGVIIGEGLPRMARVMDKVTLIRTMQHHMRNHNSATYFSLTGHAPPVDDIRLRDTLDLFPAYGSVVNRFLPGRNGMPAFVAYPYVIRDGSISPGQHASFLGKAHDPLLFTQDPNAPNFGLPELRLPANVSLDQLENRRAMLSIIDQQTQLLEESALARGISDNHQRALGMITSPRIREAFDLSREPAYVRDQYGRTTYGQSCLLARRLVEAGARFVNVYFSPTIGGNRSGWDMHGFDGQNISPILREWLLPQTDRTLPTLITDLDERGLLDTTLVVWMGEFGRTPRINNTNGRDHWPDCYTAVLAGGGVRRGHVHGSSDRIGAYPTGDLVRLGDLAATMFSLLGLDPHTEIYDRLNRPFPIATGSPVTGILA